MELNLSILKKPYISFTRYLFITGLFLFVLIIVVLIPGIADAYSVIPSGITPSGVSDAFNPVDTPLADYVFWFNGSQFNTDFNESVSPYPSLNYESLYGGSMGDGTYTLYSLAAGLGSACAATESVCESTATGRVVYTRTAGVWSSEYVFSTTTRIISVIPESGTTTATSTSFEFGADIYSNFSEYQDDWFLRIKYIRNQSSLAAVSNTALLYKTFEFPILSGGESNYSTTTSLLIGGQYTMITQIRKVTFINNVLGFFGLDNIFDTGLILSTSTQFTVDKLSDYDKFVASTTEGITGFIASSTCATISWTNFNLPNLGTCLFAWQEKPMKEALDGIRNGFFAYAPWGYVNRAVAIISASTTMPLPDLSYTFPSTFPAAQLAGVNITFSPWQYGYGDGSLINTTKSLGDDPKNVWEIMEIPTKIIIYMILIFMIIHDITGIHTHHKNQRNDNEIST